jgi:hypothetical protein
VGFPVATRTIDVAIRHLFASFTLHQDNRLPARIAGIGHDFDPCINSKKEKEVSSQQQQAAASSKGVNYENENADAPKRSR